MKLRQTKYTILATVE